MTRRFWGPLLTNAAGYVLCMLASVYVAEPAAPEIAKIVYAGMSPFSHHEPSAITSFYTSNWLLFNMVAGVGCGFTIYSLWRHAIAMLVWVPPACVLCRQMLLRPQSVLYSTARGSQARYFLSVGCPEVSLQSFYISQRCADQFHYSLPLYAAVGFSAGALLSLSYWRHKNDSSKSPLLPPPQDAGETVGNHYQPQKNRGDAEK